MKQRLFLTPFSIMQLLGVQNRELSYSDINPGYFDFGKYVVPVWKIGDIGYISFDGNEFEAPCGVPFFTSTLGTVFTFEEIESSFLRSYVMCKDNGHHQRAFEMSVNAPVGVISYEYTARFSMKTGKLSWKEKIDRIVEHIKESLRFCGTLSFLFGL